MSNVNILKTSAELVEDMAESDSNMRTLLSYLSIEAKDVIFVEWNNEALR